MSIKYLPSRCATAVLTLLSLLPLKVHYFISDVLIFPLVFYVLRYRRKIVWRNLTHSFPERSEAELRMTERKFYHWFSDLLVETVKAHTFSRKESLRRMEFRNIEVIHEAIAEGHDFVVVYLSHYCNWEWCVNFPLFKPSVGLCQIYHPLHDKEIDRWMSSSRSRFGAVNIAMKETLRKLVRLRQAMKEGTMIGSDGKTPVKGMLMGTIADQVPTAQSIHLRIPFLHQDTAVFTGSEKIGRKLGAGFAYVKLERVEGRRGHYVGTFERLDPLPNAADDEFAYTRAYFQRLERDIRECPELWLWTHNRWKR